MITNITKQSETPPITYTFQEIFSKKFDDLYRATVERNDWCNDLVFLLEGNHYMLFGRCGERQCLVNLEDSDIIFDSKDAKTPQYRDELLTVVKAEVGISINILTR